MPFRFIPLEFPELMLIEIQEFKDERGFFREIYLSAEFKAHGIKDDFIYDTRSVSRKGVLRGMHYQVHPQAQGKLVTVLRGKAFDAVIDLRKHSPAYAKWFGTILSEEQPKMMWIPPGFAHGFVALEENTETCYKSTNAYAPNFEKGVLWSDPEIGISWPIERPILSEKDRGLPGFREAEHNFE